MKANNTKIKYTGLAAFLIPFIICVFICISNGVYPFGDNCILHIDMYHQYCPFFTEFRNKLLSGGSLQYSWNLGLGSDFVSLYAYYLASPLNFLIILCPKAYVIEFMTLLELVKIGLCGFTFYLFLKHRFEFVGKDGELHINQAVPALVFSTAYALSGFVAAYSWDIMWMDCIALFPLILLGLRRLVKEGKPGMYFITLSVCIFANYYISIMICIFLVFYFFYLITEKGVKRGAAVLRFSWYSLLSGAASLILILPEIAILSTSGSVSEGFPETAEWYFNIIAELGRGAAVTNVYTGTEHWPNLYAGAFSLVLVWLYFLNSRIKKREKILPGLMLVFLLVSFSENQLDYIWHGMHFPQSLPGRQSFIYVFIILFMGFSVIRKWKGTKNWHITVSTIIALVLLVAEVYFGDDSVTEPSAILITGLLVAFYGLLMLFSRLSGGKFKAVLFDVAIGVCIGELAVNMALTGLGTTSRVAYTDKKEDYTELLSKAEEDNEEDGGVFYRVEDAGRKTKNDDSLYGYSSSTIFSSLMNLNVSHFYQSLYMEGGKNFYCYNGATPLTSALFSVKYFLSSCGMEESPVRTLIGESNGNYLYKNNYNLPLGYIIPEEAIDDWEPSDTDRLGSLNSFAIALGADERMLYQPDYTTEENPGSTTIEIPEDGYYYADYVSCSADTLTVSRSDGWTKSYSKTTHRYLLELGWCTAGTSVSITNTAGEEISYHLYEMNFDALDAAYSTLTEQTFSTESISDTSVEGSITVTEAGRLVFSIPADEGWTLYVDGKETGIEPLSDALIGVSLTEGEHEISLKYKAPGLKTGALGSAAALALFGLSIWVEEKRRRKLDI
jgi:uncharacterized membrane protein YfhO